MIYHLRIFTVFYRVFSRYFMRMIEGICNFLQKPPSFTLTVNPYGIKPACQQVRTKFRTSKINDFLHPAK
jgi:hypothetical protein